MCRGATAVPLSVCLSMTSAPLPGKGARLAVEACLPRCLFTAVAAMARWAAAAAARLGRAAVAGARLGAGLSSAAAATPRRGRASVPAACSGSGVSLTNSGVASVFAPFSASCRHGMYICLRIPSMPAEKVMNHTDIWLLCERLASRIAQYSWHCRQHAVHCCRRRACCGSGCAADGDASSSPLPASPALSSDNFTAAF